MSSRPYAASIRALGPGGRPRRVVWSEKQPGFGVRYYASGRSSYVVLSLMNGVTRTIIRGLETGADDYVTKPFDPRELLARIKSVMRRAQARPAAGAEAVPGAAAQRLRFGRCRLDVGSHQLFDAHGGEIPLTSMEFDLLKIFAEHPGKALSRDRILTLTKNREWDPYDRSIDIRIARLRRKVEADPENPLVIRTVRGVGYMFVPTAD